MMMYYGTCLMLLWAMFDGCLQAAGGFVPAAVLIRQQQNSNFQSKTAEETEKRFAYGGADILGFQNLVDSDFAPENKKNLTANFEFALRLIRISEDKKKCLATVLLAKIADGLLKKDASEDRQLALTMSDTMDEYAWAKAHTKMKELYSKLCEIANKNQTARVSCRPMDGPGEMINNAADSGFSKEVQGTTTDNQQEIQQTNASPHQKQENNNDTHAAAIDAMIRKTQITLSNVSKRSETEDVSPEDMYKKADEAKRQEDARKILEEKRRQESAKIEEEKRKKLEQEAQEKILQRATEEESVKKAMDEQAKKNAAHSRKLFQQKEKDAQSNTLLPGNSPVNRRNPSGLHKNNSVPSSPQSKKEEHLQTSSQEQSVAPPKISLKPIAQAIPTSMIVKPNLSHQEERATSPNANHVCEVGIPQSPDQIRDPVKSIVEKIEAQNDQKKASLGHAKLVSESEKEVKVSFLKNSWKYFAIGGTACGLFLFVNYYAAIEKWVKRKTSGLKTNKLKKKSAYQWS